MAEVLAPLHVESAGTAHLGLKDPLPRWSTHMLAISWALHWAEPGNLGSLRVDLSTDFLTTW